MRLGDRQAMHLESATGQQYIKETRCVADESRPQRKTLYVDSRQWLDDFLAEALHDGGEQPVLAAEISIDVGLRSARLTHDGVDADAGVAVFEKTFGCDRDDFLALAVGSRFTGLGHGVALSFGRMPPLRP